MVGETDARLVIDARAGDQESLDELVARYLPLVYNIVGRALAGQGDVDDVVQETMLRLVRGLDYYTRTTFEFTVTTGLGTQNALLGGGRYDGLSEMLGGPKAPGIGFAIGEDRLILTLQAQAEADGIAVGAPKLDAYVAPLGVAQQPAALALARELRRAGLSVDVGDGSFKLRKSFDVADSVARHIVLLGEDEVKAGVATVKNFASSEQTKTRVGELAAELRK